MDKLSRFKLRFDGPEGTELDDMYQYLEEMLVKDDASRVAVKYVDKDDDEEEEPEREYKTEFSSSSSSIEMGHQERMRERHYNSDLDADPLGTHDINAGSHAKKLRDDETANPDRGIMLQAQNEAVAVEYNGNLAQAQSEGMSKGNGMINYTANVLDIEYEAPELINGQKTYQRIVFEAEKDGETVYETTMKKFMDAGMDVKAERDSDFGTMIFTSLNNRKEGTDGNFNEFYLNGEIGDNAIDQQMLKKGDVVEWRYAEETDGSCGGVPDFNRIKNLLQKYNTVGNGSGPQDMINPFIPPNMVMNYGRGR